MALLKVKDYKMWVILINLLPLSIFAQKKGTLRVYSSQPQTTVRIDSSVIQMGNSISYTTQLPEGTYTIKMWASQCAMITKVVTIKADSVETLRTAFTTSPEYQAHIEANKQYSTAKNRIAAFKTGLILGNLGLTYLTTYFGRTKTKDNELALQDLNRRYTISPTDVFLERDYYKAKDNYESSVKFYNIKLIVGIPITLASYYFSYKRWKKLSQSAPTKPIFKETNPIARAEWQLTPNCDVWSNNIGLNFNLKF